MRRASPFSLHPALLAILLLGWSLYLLYGKLANVDTHFTYRPEGYPQLFNVSPWHPFTLSTPAGPQNGFTRTAICPLTFFTLRYTYWSSDGGATREGLAWDNDVRWGRVIVAMAASAIALVVLNYLARLILNRFWPLAE